MYLDATTVYDRGHAWQSANDRVAWERAIAQGSATEQKMGLALRNADPATPSALIANTMTAFRLPPRFGYNRTEPGIMDVVRLTDTENFGHAGDVPAADFSGQPQSVGKATEIPSLPWF